MIQKIKTYPFLQKFFAGFVVAFLLLAPVGTSVINVAHAAGSWCHVGDVCFVTKAECDASVAKVNEDSMIKGYICVEKGSALDVAGSFIVDTALAPFKWLVDVIAWVIISLSEKVFSFATLIFNYALDYTIVNFDDSYGDVKNGIETAWKAFRDVGNILLITMFAYAAFRIILGLDNFGLKSFIAKTIIIALLVNFSLLFTKLVIDVSNIVAVQVVSSLSAEDGTVIDVGAVFAQKTGITANASNWSRLQEVRDQDGSAVVYAIMTSVFFWVSAAVFFYGAFLMIIRYLVLLLLLLFSAVAFVSFAAPNVNQFAQWRDKLINYSLFAPLFMLTLWAVVLVTSNMDAQYGGSLLDAVIHDDVTAEKLFMQFAIMLGLLFAATKIASSLSLAGANWASGKFGKMVGVGTGAGLVARAGRATLGRVGQLASESNRLQEWRGKKGMANVAQRNIARMALDASSKAAKRTYDLRDSKLAKALEKTSGVNLGKGIESYEKQMKTNADYMAKADTAAAKRRAEEAYKGEAQSATAEKENTAKAFETAQKEVINYQKKNATVGGASQEAAQLNDSIQVANKQVDAMNKQREAAQRELAQATEISDKERLSSVISESDAKIRKLRKTMDDQKQRITALRDAHGSRIENYETMLGQKQERADKLKAEAAQAQQRVKDVEDQKTKLATKLKGEFLDEQEKSVIADVAAHIPYAGRALSVALNDTRDVQMARKILKKDPNEEKIEKFLTKKIKDLNKDGGTSTDDGNKNS